MSLKKDVHKAKKKRIEVKIPDITNLATKTTLSAKINEVKCKIPNITNLATNIFFNAKINANNYYIATTSAFSAVQNKIPSVSNLVKKTDYNTKIIKIEKKNTDHNHDKYITTSEFNKFTVESFVARLKQANLASKSDIANFVKKIDFDNKLKNATSNITELN